MRWEGVSSTNGGEETFKQAIGEETLKKETRWKIQARWENNIKTDLKETGLDGEDWIDMAQDWDKWRALFKTIMNVRVP